MNLQEGNLDELAMILNPIGDNESEDNGEDSNGDGEANDGN